MLVAAAPTPAASAATASTAVRRAGIGHRVRGRGGAVAIAAARCEGGQLALELRAVTERALRTAVTGAHECLERVVALGASVFVNRHLFLYSPVGWAYSTSTPRVALGCRKQIIPARPRRGF